MTTATKLPTIKIGMKTIMAQWLRSKDACGDQVRLFHDVFGNSADLTRSNLAKAAERGLSLDWLAEKILTAQEYERATARALQEYQRATAPAWQEYERATARALQEYQRATRPSWQEYERAMARALQEYQRATAQARQEYQRATAPALADVLGLPADGVEIGGAA